MSGEIKLYLLFTAVKLAGYALACVLLARYYHKSYSTGVLAGIVRTLIGMGIGVLVFYGVTKGWGTGAVTNSPALASLLAAVRVLEWTAVFWLFFRLDRKAFLMLPIAIVWSFLLDLAGLFLFSGLIRGIIC